jgi:hypothetical protein
VAKSLSTSCWICSGVAMRSHSSGCAATQPISANDTAENAVATAHHHGQDR